MTADLRAQVRGTSSEQALLALHEAGGGLSQANLETQLGLDTFDTHETVKTLDELGLVAGLSFDRVPLSGLGRHVAAEIVRSHTLGEDRRDAVQRTIVERLLQHRPRSERAWQVTDVDGRPVAPAELLRALTKLETWECVNVDRRGGGIHHVSVGEAAHEVEGIPGLLQNHFELPTGSSYDYRTSTTTVTGSTVGAVQTGGTGNTQTVSQIVSTDQRAIILSKVDEILQDLASADGDTPELRQAIEAIKTEALNASTTPQSMRSRITEAIAIAGSIQGIELTLQGLAQLLGMLP